MLDDLTARPYFIRAVHQWCVDRGHTPYLLARSRPGQYPQIPSKLTDKEGIVFNIASPAVRNLVIDADGVCFTGRFLGKIVEVRVPLADVVAVYAREANKGFSFPPPKEGEAEDEAAKAQNPADSGASGEIPAKTAAKTAAAAAKPNLSAAKGGGAARKSAAGKRGKTPNLRVI